MYNDCINYFKIRQSCKMVDVMMKGYIYGSLPMHSQQLSAKGGERNPPKWYPFYINDRYYLREACQ